MEVTVQAILKLRDTGQVLYNRYIDLKQFFCYEAFYNGILIRRITICCNSHGGTSDFDLALCCHLFFLFCKGRN